jgi:sugar O-acyltransferase (sialic acid O-acetyltransferase NeuD family)
VAETPLLIYGNGAVARLVFSFVRRTRTVIGFTVDDAVMQGETSFCGLPLYPFSAIEQHAPPSACDMLIAIGFVDMNRLRLRKYEEAKAKGYRFASYVDPGLILHDGVSIGENTIILDHTSIHAGCSIGANVFITSNVNLGHDCEIGDGAFINAGVSLAGGCKVGDGAFFGVNACAAHGVSIGAHAFIGANTLADKDVPEAGVIISPGGTPFRLNAHDFVRFTRQA